MSPALLALEAELQARDAATWRSYGPPDRDPAAIGTARVQCEGCGEMFDADRAYGPEDEPLCPTCADGWLREGAPQPDECEPRRDALDGEYLIFLPSSAGPDIREVAL